VKLHTEKATQVFREEEVLNYLYESVFKEKTHLGRISFINGRKH